MTNFSPKTLKRFRFRQFTDIKHVQLEKHMQRKTERRKKPLRYGV